VPLTTVESTSTLNLLPNNLWFDVGPPAHRGTNPPCVTFNTYDLTLVHWGIDPSTHCTQIQPIYLEFDNNTLVHPSNQLPTNFDSIYSTRAPGHQGTSLSAHRGNHHHSLFQVILGPLNMIFSWGVLITKIYVGDFLHMLLRLSMLHAQATRVSLCL
jgi:hypothetical protein